MTEAPDLDQLLQVAFAREKAAARRLARRDGLSQLTALCQILMQSPTLTPTPAGLNELVADRLLAQAAQIQRRTERRQAAVERHASKKAQRLPDPAAWHGWFDGSALPNPGRLGIGAVLRAPDGSVRHISRAAGIGEGNAAEYFALIALLEAAVALQVARLVVHGDSQVVLQDLNGRAPVRTDALVDSRRRAMRLMRKIDSVELVWIPRSRNAAADALARAASIPTGGLKRGTD